MSDEEPNLESRVAARRALQCAEQAKTSAEALLNKQPRNARTDVASAHLLLREALYWTAISARGLRDRAVLEPSALGFGEAWSALQSLEPSEPKDAPSEAVLEQARRAFTGRSLLAARQLPESELTTETQALRDVLSGWLARVRSRLPASQQRATWRRLSRLLVVALVAGNLVVIGYNWRYLSKRDNLALHKRVTTSSVYGEDHDPRGAVDGIVDRVGFHTWPDFKPWVEIDLGSVETITEVEVFNRTDCCQSRAVPLTILVSTDGKTYQEVARRNKVFDTWRATFPKVAARFVKLVLNRREWFHLAEIRVR